MLIKEHVAMTMVLGTAALICGCGVSPGMPGTDLQVTNGSG